MSIFTLKFLVTCETSLGEVVYICGNTAQLGNWNPQNGMRLYTDATLYPKWDPYRTIQIRQGNKLLFKLCTVNQAKQLKWQNVSGNRQIIAKQNLLVEFTANFQEIILTPLTEQISKAPRKKTCDILNELQSDGSSSKQYWRQFMQEQQQSILYITLTTQMRKIVQYQNDIFISEHLDTHRSSAEFDKNLQTKIQKCSQVIHKTSNFYCILQNAENDQLISFLGQDSYLIKFSQFSSYSIHNNQIPVFFHIQSLKQGTQNQSCFEVFDNISRIVHAENILLGEKQKKLEFYISMRMVWDPSQQLIQKIVQKKVALVLIQSQRILELFLEIITLMNLQYYTQDYTEITIFLKNLGTLVIKLVVQNDVTFKSANSSLQKKQRIQSQNKYFDSIKKLILQNNNKSYVGCCKNSFIQSIKQDDTFAGLIYHRKNIMIVNAQKVEDINSKLLTQIIALSSKPNFQIFIIIDKLTQDIKVKFPTSKNNKIVVIGKNGTIYANQQTFIDVCQIVNLDKNKFLESMSKIQWSITLGLDNKQVANNQTVFEFKRGHVGRLGLDILKTKIKQHNEQSLHKLVLEQKQGSKYSIRPYCLTQQFFLKAIFENLSKHVHDQRSFVFTVNMKNDNKFIHKANTLFHKIFKHKNSIKMRNVQIIANNEIQYSGISKQEVINTLSLQAQLQFMCEHFLTGSHLKSYNLNLLGPRKGSRRSFMDKLNVHNYSSEMF